MSNHPVSDGSRSDRAAGLLGHPSSWGEDSDTRHLERSGRCRIYFDGSRTKSAGGSGQRDSALDRIHSAISVPSGGAAGFAVANFGGTADFVHGGISEFQAGGTGADVEILTE